jgi:hypothetical protein
MNLCGGITGISEHELILQIPDEEYNVIPISRKQKSSSSSTSKRRSKSPSKDKTMLLAQQTSLSNNRPSSRSRSSRGGLTSVSSTNQQQNSASSSSSMLNPVSRHDYEKLKSRQHRSQPLTTSHGHKSSSILTKKLEYGFNLVSRYLILYIIYHILYII